MSPPAGGGGEPPAVTARTRLQELYAKVDAFFVRAAERFQGPGGITCHAGCDDCCRRRFTVTAIEAEVIAEGLTTLPLAAREALAARAAEGDAAPCPALEQDGRCAIYPFRPVLCRTHGLPIRFASPRSLPLARPEPAPSRTASAALRPAQVSACPRNFEARDLNALPPEIVLDQTTLSTVLGALDAARAAEAGCPAGPPARVPIAALLTGTTR